MVGAVFLSRAERRSNAQMQGFSLGAQIVSASIVPGGEAGYAGMDGGR